MALVNLTPQQMTELGLELVGYGRRNLSDASKIDVFRSLFGASPEACSHALTDLQLMGVIPNDTVKSVEPRYFLVALHWMKTYKTEPDMSGRFKRSVRTLRTWIWGYVEAFQALKPHKVNEYTMSSFFLDF